MVCLLQCRVPYTVDASELRESLLYHIFIAPSHSHVEVTKLSCPHHEGAGYPHPIRGDYREE